jgi:hypothetical protein
VLNYSYLVIFTTDRFFDYDAFFFTEEEAFTAREDHRARNMLSDAVIYRLRPTRWRTGITTDQRERATFEPASNTFVGWDGGSGS